MFRLAMLLVLLIATPVFAETMLQGEVSGVLTKDAEPYRVQDTLLVPYGTTLTIEAGVNVIFDAAVPVIVDGAIIAEGTSTDSVRFVRGAADHWSGIRITDGTGSFAYTRFSDGLVQGIEGYGGAIIAKGAAARVSLANCVLNGNGASSGGAIYTRDGAELTLTDCALVGNHANGPGGGGALSVHGPTILVDCLLSENSGYLTGTISGAVTAVRCDFIGNTSEMGPAVATRGSFTDCIFEGNTASKGGVIEPAGLVRIANSGEFIDDLPIVETVLIGSEFIDNATSSAPIAINGDSLCHVTISDCVIRDNVSIASNSAIDVFGRDDVEFPITRRRPVVSIERTVIAGNTGYGYAAIGISNAIVTAYHCTFTGNEWAPRIPGVIPYPPPTISAFSAYESDLTITNSILWESDGVQSSGSDVAISYSDIMGGWPGEGNIDTDPLFVNPDANDYSLQGGSPAIGAGTLLALNILPPPNRPDMGAIPYDWDQYERPTDVAQETDRPAAFDLLAPFPNPFNPTTTLRFSVPNESAARIAVYDGTGRLVSVVADGSYDAGNHAVVWDGCDATGREVASGVYVVRLTLSDRGETLTQRVTLVR